MSFLHHSIAVSSAEPTQSPVVLTDQNFSIFELQETDTPLQIGLDIFFQRDGDYRALGVNSATVYNIPGQWYSVLGAPNPGDDHWVRWTKTGGDDPTVPGFPAFGVWHQMSQNRIWRWRIPDGTLTYQGLVEIAADAAGTEILDSSTIDATITSVVIPGGT